MSLPDNAIIVDDEIIPGEPKCEYCTHYESLHMEGTGPCSRTIAIIPDPELEKAGKGSKINVIHPRIKCDCAKFQTKDDEN